MGERFLWKPGLRCGGKTGPGDCRGIGTRSRNEYVLLLFPIFLSILLQGCMCQSNLIAGENATERKTCINGTLWDGVLSVENATVWQQAMNTTGLKLVLESSESRGDTVFVVRDSDVLDCEDRSVAECRQVELQWKLQLSSPTAAGLLLLNWIPSTLNQSDLNESGVVIETKLGQLFRMTGENDDLFQLEVVSQGKNNSIVDSNNETNIIEQVGLVDGEKARTGRLGGAASAQVTEMIEVCEGGGTVYVLDEVVYPEGLPMVNVSDLPLLNDRCWESIMALSRRTGISFPYLLLATYANPVVDSLLDPATNVTLLVPSFTGALDPSFWVTSGSATEIKEITTFLLTHFIQGGLCPDDLDGNSFQTLTGEYAGEEYYLEFTRDEKDPNNFKVDLLFGDQNVEYQATYVGTACHSTVYTLDGLLTPWSDKNLPELLEAEKLSRIPEVSDEADLYNVTYSCGQSKGMATASSSDDGSLSGGAIAGIVIGVVVGTIALIGMAVFIVRRKGKKPNVVDGEKVKDSNSDILNSFKSSDEFKGQAVEPFSLGGMSSRMSSGAVDLPWDDLVLKPEDIVFDVVPETHERVLLGAGRFGKVYSAKLFDSERVAVKCIQRDDLETMHLALASAAGSGRDLVRKKSDTTQSDEAYASGSVASQSSPFVSKSISPSNQVLREIALLKACRSQHVVSFMGACFLDGEVQLVTELMPAGDLWNALRRGQVSWSRCGRQIAMDVASGLSYLHSRRVIHLDLKSSNILLRWCGGPEECKDTSSNLGTRESEVSSCKYQAKVSDVGLARILPDSREYISSLGGAGTWNWCAPEVILSQKCTSAADMWSFGVILWELCTQEIPVRGRMRPVKVPKECPLAVSKLIDQCSEVNPADRPTAVEALRILEALSD